MTQQIINVGTDPNDGTGDPLRLAFEKANANFTDLYNGGGGGGGGFNGGTITNPLTITSDAVNGQGALKLTGAVNPDPSSTGLIEVGGLLNFADTDIVASIIHNVDSYSQFILQNQSSGESASSDYIVNNDSPLGTQIYGDFGINSTTFTGITPFDIANGTYLHSSGGQLAIGTITDNDILIATDSVTRITVDAAGPVTFDTTSTVHINSTQNATSHTTGALVIEGGVGVGGNIVVDTALYVGTAAATATLGNPTIVAKQSGAEYIQAAIINSSATGSADWVAYANNGTTAHGWADMGFTGSAFNDPAYTIVQEGDGYLFAAGVPDGTSHGSLVLCTHDTGVDNDLVFGTGGFTTANEKMRFKNAISQFHIQPTTAATSTTTGALRVDGGVGIGGDLYAGDIYSNGVLLTGGGGGSNALVNGTFDVILDIAGNLDLPQNVRISSNSSVTSAPSVDTVIYTGSDRYQHTIKILVKVEGVEGNVAGAEPADWDTQSCEIMVAKSFKSNRVVASVYGVTYTSVAPLATFTANWNSISNRVEIKCQPTSTTNNVYVRASALEITTSD